MNKIRMVCLLFIVLLLMVSCNHAVEYEGPVLPQPRGLVDRTVLVYIVGDCGYSDGELSDLFEVNFQDMLKGMRYVDYSKCNLIVYSEMVDDVPRLISVKKTGERVVADTVFTYEEQNPLDKQVMSSVISQTVNYFPAKSYGFAFLSHSASWLPATKKMNDRSIGMYRKTQMDITDFHYALLSFPKPLKFILFDSCLMQAVEVAYELRDCVEFLIGSPTEIPGPGAPYDKVVPEFFAEEDCASRIASAYFKEYKNRYTGSINGSGYWTRGVSISAVKTSALDLLADKTGIVYAQAIGELGHLQKAGIQRYDWSSNDANYDLNGFISSLLREDDELYREWKNAFDDAVVYWNTTPKNYSDFHQMFSMDKAHGLSVYIPEGVYNSQRNIFYRTLQWAKAVGLDRIMWK
ncbi:clostripain family protein [gut metagenome]|uniref:Clostripain family protein n=1 Tax=gut metagenome TaxID=749906 RepID=J9H0J7_9ZZZZ